MRGRVFFGIVVVAFVYLSCEDPVTLSVSKTFGNNNLITSFVDTFSVFTSTVQLDTIPTGGTGVALLGIYSDSKLGSVRSSPYLQFGYDGSFLPGTQSLFDSICLILPYNHQYYGDTTQFVQFNVHEMTQIPLPGTNPPTLDFKRSFFNSSGFYSSRNAPIDPTPLASYSVKFFPHHDSLLLRLPDAMGQKWFARAQFEELKRKNGESLSTDSTFFANSSTFTLNYFRGLHFQTSSSTGNAMVGFNVDAGTRSAGRIVKVRIYYRHLVNDIMVQTHFDFSPKNTAYQFQNITYDRSGTELSGLQSRQKISPSTDHETYVQAGTGLVTRLDFPSLKNFFADKRHIFNGAYLEVYPVQGSYSKSTIPPSQLYLYTTDVSNVPSIEPGRPSAIIQSAQIQYDYEYGIRTLYTFSLFNYFQQEFSTTGPNITPLLLGPPQTQLGNNVQRVYIGDRFHPISKIKLKIFYSYAPN